MNSPSEIEINDLILSRGKIFCVIGEGKLCIQLLSFLQNSFQNSFQKENNMIICEKDSLDDIIEKSNSIHNFSLIFYKNINYCIWDKSVIDILSNKKGVKVFSTSLIQLIPLHIKLDIDIWIITKECSREGITSLFSSLSIKYGIDSFLELLRMYRVIIIWKKNREYKLCSLSEVCPEKSLQILSLVGSMTSPDISRIILDYTYSLI